MKAFAKVVAFIVAGLMSAPALAADGERIITLGPGIQIAPPYEGASHTTILPFPSFSFGREGQAWQFTAPDDSPSIGLISGIFRAGIAVAFRGARDDDGSLVGLKPIDAVVEPGLFVDVWPVEWLRTRVEVRKGVTGHKGWATDISADLVQPIGAFTFAVGPRFGLGDSGYMKKYFSISAAEALANPTISESFSASAGPRFIGGAVSIIHRPGGRWTQSLGVAYHRLIGDAADSPFVKQLGTADQWILVTKVGYSF